MFLCKFANAFFNLFGCLACNSGNFFCHESFFIIIPYYMESKTFANIV